jgi:hypothetical protein
VFGDREVVAEGERVGVVGAGDPLAIGQGLLEQREWPCQIPGRLVHAGEIVPEASALGWSGAEDPLAVGQYLLDQVDGPGSPAVGGRTRLRRVRLHSRGAETEPMMSRASAWSIHPVPMILALGGVGA